MVYLVSYDLNRPRGDDDYPNLINALRNDGAVKILFSEWLVRSNGTAKQVGDRYLAHMDSNDRIFVCEVLQGRWAKYNLMNDPTAQTLLP